MADPYATHEDYTQLTLEPLEATEEQDQVDALLAQASALMRIKVPGLDGRILAGTFDVVLAVGICVQVVQRYLDNPTRAAQSGTGPFTKSWASANARGLWLTDDELDTLAPPPPVGRVRGVGTIRLNTPVTPRCGWGRR